MTSFELESIFEISSLNGSFNPSSAGAAKEVAEKEIIKMNSMHLIVFIVFGFK